jgi:hypothetical protein
MRMKTFRISPGISGQAAVWLLEEKKGWHKWVVVYKDPDLYNVRRMKDHLLKPPTVYTIDTNDPEKPMRKTPSSWMIHPKAKFLKIKRADLPESLKEI